MSAYLFTKLFYLFLLLLFMCGTFICGHVCASSGKAAKAAAVNNFEPFNKNKISGADMPKGEESKANNVDVKDYHSLALVSTNKVLVALAGVNRTNKENKPITVLTKHIGIEKGNWGDEVIANAGGKWQTQFAVYNECKNSGDCDGTAVVRGLAAAVNKDKIYIFLANFSTTQNVGSQTETKWWFGLVETETTQNTGGGKLIKWGDAKALAFSNATFNNIFKNKLSDIHIIDSSAFVIGEKKLVFIIKSKFKEGNTGGAGANKKVAAVFQYDVVSNQHKLELVDVEDTEGHIPSFFQWKGKLFKVPTEDSTESSGNNMMEFGAGEGQTFKQSSDPIASLCNFLKDKNNFVNATIRGNVLLFTQQKGSSAKSEVYLWMTDGTRVSRVDNIFSNIKGTFYASLSHTNNELFVLHQDYQESGAQDSNKKITFTRLNKQLESIKNILDAWKQNDGNIKEGCKDANKQNNLCAPPLPIAGLVGFLNSTANENLEIWKDEYHYRDATVKKEKSQKVENGFKFGGAGAGAKWLVGKQSQDQPYNFINTGFTLVATVEIGIGTNGKDNSILGVGLQNNAKVGLWCTIDNKWSVRVEKNGPLKKSDEECKQGTTYNAALVWDKNKNLEIYVNGKKTTFSNSEIKIQNDEKITHFYLGADTNGQESSTDESYVTVTSVLLYNQPFENTNINELREYFKSLEVTQLPDNNTNTTGSSDQPPTQLPLASPTEDEKKEDKKVPLPSRTEDGSVGGGVRVFSLLLAVLCVSAPLLLHL